MLTVRATDGEAQVEARSEANLSLLGFGLLVSGRIFLLGTSIHENRVLQRRPVLVWAWFRVSANGVSLLGQKKVGEQEPKGGAVRQSIVLGSVSGLNLGGRETIGLLPCVPCRLLGPTA